MTVVNKISILPEECPSFDLRAPDSSVSFAFTRAASLGLLLR